VNRAVLPQLREQGRGLVCISSSSARGGTPPYAGELARWGIETSIVVRGAFTEIVNAVADRVRGVVRRIGLQDLLHPPVAGREDLSGVCLTH
jgi:hypothetical protein